MKKLIPILLFAALPAVAQNAGYVPLDSSSPCMLSARASEDLVKRRISGATREQAAAAFNASKELASGLSPDQKADALEKAYAFSYSQLNPTAMASFVFVACHYKMDAQITPLVAKVAANCQARYQQFEPLTRCVENVALGLPPT